MLIRGILKPLTEIELAAQAEAHRLEGGGHSLFRSDFVAEEPDAYVSMRWAAIHLGVSYETARTWSASWHRRYVSELSGSNIVKFRLTDVLATAEKRKQMRK